MSKLDPTKGNWQKVYNETSLIQKHKILSWLQSHSSEMLVLQHAGGDTVFFIMKFCNAEALKIGNDSHVYYNKQFKEKK